ncbi:Protein tyrosine kinase [Rhizoctonia solani]|uniref:Protein tyrosine kinase n=1 Tax=Rhizoctonia solani TaxID=456999 RepID=A0A8H7M8V9_9AGAM|nr:Protein tyrosine kinase [Rhizoctonia solani]
MSETLLRRLWGELCRAVGWMHSVALVHRDIKLESVSTPIYMSWQLTILFFGVVQDILVTSNPFTQPVPPLTTPLLKLTGLWSLTLYRSRQSKIDDPMRIRGVCAPEIIMVRLTTDAKPTLGHAESSCSRYPRVYSHSQTHPGYPPRHLPTRPIPDPAAPLVPAEDRAVQYDPRELGEGVRRIVGRLLVRSPRNEPRSPSCGVIHG